MNKKILSLVLVLSLVLGSFSFAFADTGLTAEQKIEELKRLGFVEGNETGDLMLDKNIDRASTAVIVAKALEAGDGKTAEQIKDSIAKSDYQGRFPDVKTSHWANAYINNAVERGIVKGTDKGVFLPDQDITYAEVITMMVQILGKEVNKNVSWPENYIGAAREAGILEGISSNYGAKADRQGVFVLLYNTVTGNQVGNYQIDKVLVLENNRVESIDQNTVVVEVIKEVQRANFVENSRGGKAEERRGEQYRVTLPKEVAEAEDLLGKVVDLTYDKSNTAVAVKEDKTYTYKVGEITLNEKDLKVDGNTYTVQKDERYKGDDERIFRTYINNGSYTYEKAQKDFGKSLDFGRVTIKNGKVLFVDAFAFEDIAPVKEVKENGKKTEVTVYNDINDGGTKKVELEKEKVVAVNKDGKFSRIDKADIAKLDVIHVAKDNKAVVVRQDAKVDGKYEKVVEKKNSVVVVVDGEEYEVLDVDSKRPVYAYDSKDFRTLNAKDASDVLKEFKGEKSTALLDVNGNLQYLGSEIEFGEFVGIVERLVNGARVLKSDNTKIDLKATLDSDLGRKLPGTGHNSLSDYNIKDLVFVEANKKEEISTMRKLTDLKEVKGNEITKNYLGSFRVLDRTNIFIEKEDGTYYATDIKHVVDNHKNTNFTARVLSDEEYSKIDPKPRRILGERSDVAHTIVFTDITLKSDLDKSKVELVSIDNRYESIKVKDVNGSTEVYNIEKDSHAYKALRNANAVSGNIIEIGTDKDTSKKLVKEIKVLIGNKVDSDYSNVIGYVDSYSTRDKVVEINGTSYYILRDAANFVKDLQKGKYVTVSVEEGTRDIVALVEGKAASLEGVVTKVNQEENLIEVNGKVVELHRTVRLLDSNGKTLEIGKDAVIKALKLDDKLEKIVYDKDGFVTELRLAKTEDEDKDKDKLTKVEWIEKPKYDLSWIEAKLNTNEKVVVKAQDSDGNQIDVDAIEKAGNEYLVNINVSNVTPFKNVKITVEQDGKVILTETVQVRL